MPQRPLSYETRNEDHRSTDVVYSMYVLNFLQRNRYLDRKTATGIEEDRVKTLLHEHLHLRCVTMLLLPKVSRKYRKPPRPPKPALIITTDYSSVVLKFCHVCITSEKKIHTHFHRKGTAYKQKPGLPR